LGFHLLRLDGTWERQVSALRDSVTDECGLIRFDNGFYRICRDSAASFEVRLQPAVGAGPALTLQVQERDLYVTDIGGRSFGQYAKTLDKLQPSGHTLDAALRGLAEGSGGGGRSMFENQSLLVLCLAESLRDDHFATRIGQLFSWMGSQPVRGSDKELPMRQVLDEFHAWGQASEAIVASLAPDDRKALAEGRRLAWQRVDLARIDPALQARAKAIKVLKRPLRR
jgi:hypothetical protein